MFERLQPQSPDALLQLIKLHAADERADTIDLGVGVYRTADGGTPVFRAVKAAEKRLLAEQDSKAYLGPEGDTGFVKALMPHIFGPAEARMRGRLTGMQTPGGTAAVRLALALVKAAGGRRVLLGTPSWPNHAQIIEDLGLEAVLFDHVAPDGTADAAAVLTHIAAGAADAVLLHACCHNPTGIDYSAKQWDDLAQALADGSVFPIVDVAYQGLGRGMEEDAHGLRAILAAVPEAAVAYSCDKNFGLYRDRVGALYMLAAEETLSPVAASNANALARANWSMPPDHGAAAVRLALGDAALSRDWQEELTAMRDRIRAMREALASAAGRAPGVGLTELLHGNGLFAMLKLAPEQIVRLREEHGVYMAASGRINVAGLTEANLPKFVAALAKVSG